MLLRCLRPMLFCRTGLQNPPLLVISSRLRHCLAASAPSPVFNQQSSWTTLRALRPTQLQQLQQYCARPRRPAALTSVVAASALEGKQVDQGQQQHQEAEAAAQQVAAPAAAVQQAAEVAEVADGMEPAAKKQRVEGGGGAGGPARQAQQQQQRGGKKKGKTPSPEALARMEIHQAAKANDLAAALAVFDRSKEAGLKMGHDLYVSLLYLCGGGDRWDQQLQQRQAAGEEAAKEGEAAAVGAAEEQQQEQQQGVQNEESGAAQPPPATDAAAATASGDGSIGQAGASTLPAQPSAEEVMRRAQQLFDEMEGSGGRLPLNEMCYTAMARLAAGAGDADRAFQLAKDMMAAGISPKLRSFTPALIAYAEQGNADKAFEVDAAIAAQGIDLTEAEFSRLLQAATAGDSWQRAASVLRRIGSELTTLQPGTLARVQALFASPIAAAAAAAAAADGAAAGEEGAGAAGAGWEVVATEISPSGVCGCCGGQLKALDLSQEELRQFAEGIAAIAERQERRPNDFQQFKAWMERHGPFGAVIDGANVALFGQNFESGGFNFGQIRAVVNHLKSRHPDLKPLLMLHIGRTKAPPAKEPEAQALLKELTDARSFFVTPAGSNDDWYWMYASVTAGEKGLLVSNDEMRDHIFQLLAPKYFLKWKQRHQLKYKFSLTGLQLDYPPPYTTCAQELDCGSWVFPGADGTWLCARRRGQLPAGAAAGAAEGAADAEGTAAA